MDGVFHGSLENPAVVLTLGTSLWVIPGLCGKGVRAGLGAQIVSASKSQVGSRRLPGPPRLQIWGLLATWIPAVPPLLAPHSWGAAALDAASLTDGYLHWQGSAHTALRLLAGVPQERFVFLESASACGPAASGFARPCALSLSRKPWQAESGSPWHLFLL